MAAHNARIIPAQGEPAGGEAGSADEIDRTADVRPVEEADAAHLIGDAGPGEFSFDRRELGVDPDQDRDLGRRDPFGDARPDPGGKGRQLRGLGPMTERPSGPGRTAAWR